MNKKILFAVLIIAALAAAFVYFRASQLDEDRAPQLDEDQALNEIKILATNPENCSEAITRADAILKISPSSTEAWHWKGVCTFQLGKYDEAKALFEKVLVLSPDHEAAKNYLDIISSSGDLVAVDDLSRSEFEELLAIQIDPQIFDFLGAFSLPPDEVDVFSEVVLARYSSAASPEEVSQYFEEALTGAGISYADDSNDYLVTLEATIPGDAGDKEVVYAITIDRQSSPTMLGITFNKYK